MKCKDKMITGYIQRKKYGGHLWRCTIESYKINYHKNAQIDLINNYLYIYYNLCNPIVAINYMENIKLKIRSLQYFPYRGAIYSNKYNRILIYKKYLIFYEIHEEEKLIIIKRIIHSNINKNINY
jgi:plasmid stabilization system protein ParE